MAFFKCFVKPHNADYVVFGCGLCVINKTERRRQLAFSCCQKQKHEKNMFIFVNNILSKYEYKVVRITNIERIDLNDT